MENNKKSQPSTKNFVIVFSFDVGMCVLGVAMLASGDSTMGALGCFLLMVGIWVMVLACKNLSKILEEKRVHRTEHPHWKEEQFYRLCCQRGIESLSDFDTPNGSKTALLIAQDLKVSQNLTQMKKLFEAGKAEVFRINEVKKREEEAENERKRNYWFATEDGADEFYSLCLEQGVTDVSSPANCARLELLAKQSGIPLNINELKQLFERAKQKQQQIETETRIRELRNEEKAVLDWHARYKNYIGREKRIQMYSDLASIHQRKSDEYYSKYEGLVRNSIGYANALAEKEKDWALAGGIASGIAGSGAGVATALNVQRENEEIRRKNAETKNAILKLTSGAQERMHSKGVEESLLAKPLFEQAEAAKNKLVEELSEQELLTLLSPKLVSLETAETGSKKITVSIQPSSPFFIYQTVSAVIDGSIKINLLKKSNANKIGETVVCLGKDGADAPETVETYITGIDTKDEQCMVTFEPYHLWGIEK